MVFHPPEGQSSIRRLALLLANNVPLLLLGAMAGLAWANLAPEHYLQVRDFHVSSAWGAMDLRYVVNDILMSLFFALVGKQVWEALLPGGSLNNARRAATPVLCAIGGMAAPAAIYLALSALTGRWADLRQGWAIPCATDIAFSYLIARFIFGKGHPATTFLLLLAIADDALGLIVLAAFYPVQPVRPLWLTLSALAVLVGRLMREGRVENFWWYLAGPGALSWLGFALSGLHPALGLLPIIPTLPHAHLAEKPHWEATRRTDTLDRFEAFWKQPVEVILGLFGLLNAGVLLGAAGGATWVVLLALLAGKPIGIFLSGLLGTKLLRLELSDGIRARELFVTGCAAGIGFTVALFVATVAFERGPVQDAAKIGALASCSAAAVTFVAARVLKVRRWT
jgi:Na+:H+ antiporter, NhaA family